MCASRILWPKRPTKTPRHDIRWSMHVWGGFVKKNPRAGSTCPRQCTSNGWQEVPSGTNWGRCLNSMSATRTALIFTYITFKLGLVTTSCRCKLTTCMYPWYSGHAKLYIYRIHPLTCTMQKAKPACVNCQLSQVSPKVLWSSLGCFREQSGQDDRAPQGEFPGGFVWMVYPGTNEDWVEMGQDTCLPRWQ